jgi:hypothetical protein
MPGAGGVSFESGGTKGGKGFVTGGGTTMFKPKLGKSGLGALAGGELDMPSGTDYIDALIAEAALTATLDDDKSALGKLVGFWEGRLKTARASGDPRRVTEAANGLRGARDALAQLNETITNSNKLAEERMQLDRQLVANQERILAVATSQPNVIANWLIETLNGGIGGRAGYGYEVPSFAGRLAAY